MHFMSPPDLFLKYDQLWADPDNVEPMSVAFTDRDVWSKRQ